MPTDGPPKDKQSLHYIVRSGIAGGFAGCVAKTAVAPLDRVKILFQASNPDFQKYAGTWSGLFKAVGQIYHENGMRGLLQGHSATLLRIFPYAAIKYMAYDQMENLMMPTRESQTNVRRFGAGALSGVISVFVTYPLELIRVRLAFATRQTTVRPEDRLSFLNAMTHIYREGVSPPPSSATRNAPLPTVPAPTEAARAVFTRFPILKFYRGFTVTVAGMIPYAGTSFLCWNLLHEHFRPRRPSPSSSAHKTPTPVLDLSIGAVSGAVAQSVSYPFEVVRRRMQVGGLTRPDRWLRWGETVRAVYDAGGLRGFYVGLSIGYLKVVPMTAVSYAVWQWGKRVLDI